MTPQQLKAIKLALSTLREVQSETFRLLRNGQRLYAEEKVWNTIIEIKQALADHAMRETQRLGQEIEQEPVAIEYWLQDTMESGRWVKTDSMAKATAEKMLSGEYGDVFPQGRIVELPPPPQPEQEPVALPCCGYADASAVKWNPHNQVVQCHNCGQVYTTPPQRTWVNLTDEDRNDCLVEADPCECLATPEAQELMRCVEAKSRSKNT